MLRLGKCALLLLWPTAALLKDQGSRSSLVHVREESKIVAKEAQPTGKDVAEAQENLAAKEGGGSTPVAKVVELLKEMEANVIAGGKMEEEQYAKFKEFCRTQIDEKEYIIKKSEELIGKLGAKIDELKSDISALDSDVQKLGDEIDTLDSDIKKEKDDQEKDTKDYQKSAAEMDEGIEALASAIEALENSKKNMENDGAKVDLSQLRALGRHQSLNSIAAVELQSVVNLLEQKPSAYTAKTNKIIGMLRDLLKTFKTNKNDLDTESFDKTAASQKKMLSMSNERTFKQDSKDTKEKISSAKSEEKSSAQERKDTEENAKKADEDFLKELQKQCDDRADEFDKRSKSREAEIKAISEATEKIESDVMPKYGANKKLVGLSQARLRDVKAKLEASHSVPVRSLPSFVQLSLRGSGSRSREESSAVVKQVMQRLTDEAKALKSSGLALLVMKMKVLKKDQFAKVRDLIKSLISKLEDQAKEEADQKDFCDKEMKKATKARDDAALDMEEQSATITVKTAEKQKLEEQIEVLNEEIAELHKSLKEATEMRKEEKASNEKVIADAKDGEKSAKEAVSILKDYYDSQGFFLQQGQLATPTDRDGKTVGDRAPELSYEGDYKGSDAKGVLGLLDVIVSDFQRTSKTVKEAEDDAQKKFDTFESDTNKSLTKKKDSKKTAEGDVKKCENDITGAQDDLEGAEKLHKTVLEELGKLSTMCVDGEESWEERTAKRQQELEALKEAMNVLENWKG